MANNEVNTTFWGTTVGKTVKTAVYIGVSAVLTFLITAVDGNAQLFNQYTPFVNLGLVALKNLFDSKVDNLPSRER